MASTAKKELSAGTLNLKFMSRASLDGPPIPALVKRKVIDEGEWDIGPDVRRALGISSFSHSSGSASAGSSSVTYEPSYMPFVTNAEVKGRFTFKDGIRQEAPEPSTVLDDIPVKEEPRTGKPSSKPEAISLPHQQPAKSKKPTTSTSFQQMNPPKQPPTFMRPAGIDAAPSANAGKKTREVADKSPKSQKTAKRDSSTNPTTSTSPKKKKKKTHTAVL